MACLRAAVLLLACPLFAGTEPKPAASDYPVHLSVEAVSLGAEYLVRSVSAHSKTFFAQDHLVVEAALYPSKGRALTVSLGQFSLRVNKKETIPAQAPQFVAAGFKYPDWERRPTLVGVAGVGDGTVIVGAPQPTERFPGDPTVRRPLPPPQAPKAQERDEQEPATRAEDVVVEAAFPEGEIRSAAAGYLYFPYKGKPKAIRSLELLYSGPGGPVTVRLR
ncbi:MAG: hypothetical protein HY238_10625 [Acidobacteria bacterium]|nr:hypothetical protein [Acidobacteriota bacterium]